MANPSSSHKSSDMAHIATEVKDKAKETASNLAGQAGEAASSVARTAGNVASSIGQGMESAASTVGSGMQSLGGTIRESAPHSGMMGTAASGVADALDTSGRYLRTHDLSDMGQDLFGRIRRNPIPAMLVGIGIGYLFARATRS